jgi:56kDa selenium binding protein (SBP56)
MQFKHARNFSKVKPEARERIRLVETAWRRYLIVPGIRSSRLHVLDTKPDPAHPKLIRTIEADELANRAGYSRPHTVHCGPEGIYVSALADAGGERPGGVFLMDHESFDVRGRWELDRGHRSSLMISGGTSAMTPW